MCHSLCDAKRRAPVARPAVAASALKHEWPYAGMVLLPSEALLLGRSRVSPRRRVTTAQAVGLTAENPRPRRTRKVVRRGAPLPIDRSPRAKHVARAGPASLVRNGLRLTPFCDCGRARTYPARLGTVGKRTDG